MAKGTLRVNGVLIAEDTHELLLDSTDGTSNAGDNVLDEDGFEILLESSSTASIQASAGDNVVIREDDGTAVLVVDTNGKTTITGSGDLEVRAGAATPGKLLLTTDERTVVDGNKLGQIDFQAPFESAGTDAILVGASIHAEADATFAANNNKTDLVFSTGASEAAAEKMRITNDGKVGIGSASPGAPFDVKGTGTTISGTAMSNSRFAENASPFRGVQLGYISDEQTGIIASTTDSAASDLEFWNYSGTAWAANMRIKSDGKVGIGTSAPDTALSVAGLTTGAAIAIQSYTTTATQGAQLFLARSNNGTLGTQTAVDADDLLGGISFQGSYGSGFGTGAQIRGFAEETWSGTAVGSSLRFYTTDNTTTTLDERMRIYHNGRFGIGGSSASEAVHIQGAAGGNNCFLTIFRSSGTGSHQSGVYFGANDGTFSTHAAAGIWAANPSNPNCYMYFAAYASGLSATHNLYNGVFNGDFNDTSDRGLKENIEPLKSGALELINDLKPVKFNWKKEKGRDSDNRKLGFIAQDIETIIPEAVSGEDYDPNKADDHSEGHNGGKSMNNNAVIAVLTKAVQELSAKVKALENA